MEEIVWKLNSDYGFELSPNEVQKITRQAEAANRVFKCLGEIDLTGVTPIMKVDTTAKNVKKD
ncbi:MAG: hypothetical protein ACE5HC_12485 [Candidatus Binatia bacterium]